MKLFGFYITRTDWEGVSIINYKNGLLWLQRANELQKSLDYIKGYQSQTYIDKGGRIRYKHNGQFAPDNRSKFKQTHDRLRSEVNHSKLHGSWDEIKQASKLENFGR